MGGKVTSATDEMVWLNTRSGRYHGRGSVWYRNTKQGQLMTESEAIASGARAAEEGGLRAAQHGLAEHRLLKEAQRPFEGVAHEGWTLSAVERRAGGTKVIDELWINHAEKRIVVVDTYTGPVELAAHAKRGWAYMNEPYIRELRRQGYTYDYQVAIKHPEKIH
jgi:hypothetical protein